MNTPFRRHGTKRFIRGHYSKLSVSLIENSKSCQHLLNALAAKVKKEMKELCNLENNSILRDDIEAVKHFSWETVWLELKRSTPTLASLLTKLWYRQPNKLLTCFIISLFLKQRLRNMSLVQHAISVLLYGNGASKQVANYDAIILDYIVCTFYYFYRCIIVYNH